DSAAARGLADARAGVAVRAAVARAAGRRRVAAGALEAVDGAARARDRLAGPRAGGAGRAADAGAANRLLIADVVGLPAERDRPRRRAGLRVHVARAAAAVGVGGAGVAGGMAAVAELRALAALAGVRTAAAGRAAGGA